MGRLESLDAIGSMIAGQSGELRRPPGHTAALPGEKQMCTLAATAMSIVSMSIVGAYMPNEPRYGGRAGAQPGQHLRGALPISPYEPTTRDRCQVLAEGK